MVPYSPDHRVINAVRSPLGMGALIVLSLDLALGGVLFTALSNEAKEVSLAVFASGLFVVGLSTVILTFKNARILVYGPSELLEQSRIEYEHNLAVLKLEMEHREK